MTKEELEMGMVNAMDVIIKKAEEIKDTELLSNPDSVVKSAAILMAFPYSGKETLHEKELLETAEAILNTVDFKSMVDIIELRIYTHESRN